MIAGNRDVFAGGSASEQLTVFRIIWFALLISTMMFLLAFYITNPENFEISLKMDEFINQFRGRELPPVLPVIAIGNIGLAILIPKLMVKMTLKTSKKLELRHYFAPFIVRLILIESVALVGFLVGFPTKDVNNFLPFLMLCQFFHLRYIPLSAEKIKRDLNPYSDTAMKKLQDESETVTL